MILPNHMEIENSLPYCFAMHNRLQFPCLHNATCAQPGVTESFLRFL